MGNFSSKIPNHQRKDLPVALKKWKLLETAYQLINHPPISVPNKTVDPWTDSNQVWDDDDDVAAWDFQQKNVTRFFFTGETASPRRLVIRPEASMFKDLS